MKDSVLKKADVNDVLSEIERMKDVNTKAFNSLSDSVDYVRQAMKGVNDPGAFRRLKDLEATLDEAEKEIYSSISVLQQELGM